MNGNGPLRGSDEQSVRLTEQDARDGFRGNWGADDLAALSRYDGLVLSAYAKQTADRVWAVSATSLLAAMDTGRAVEEFTAFLTQRAEHDLPSTLDTLIDDVTPPSRATGGSRPRPRDRMRRPRHRRAHHQELKFRKALLTLGYVMPGRS